ncbi:DNA gyrase/topoisomerase IV subunit A [Flavobacteriaceae bacterium]|nr:DNA gyrase/topoisomerase IV subunit A [Flavobacteriaceae bacterium]
MIKEEKDNNHTNQIHDTSESITRVTGMYKDWFLDYASYVILERAVPAIEDGFKPVQRRIMQSMKDLDDGRYNKVANIVGHTMQYHPHGDASIADAMVQIGQKDLLIDTQGNWGNTLTGDRAAASRYIEARISKFGLDVIFNPKITKWQASYDGRRKEPVNLPVKFPLLLAQGAEGIAVGLSTKILSHNFIELIDSSIKHLQGKKINILPDFITGGIADFSNYNDGKRGGKVRLRAKISTIDKSTLLISEIPYGTTTTSLIDSILKANDRGKIRIKKIDDNTASKVEILIYLPNGISPDKTIDALYAFTNCETSISPLGCVIDNNRPLFIGVSDILKISTDNTVDLLKEELLIKLGELENQWHYSSLERIFIENKIYRDIENQDTWNGVLKAIDLGLRPYTEILKRDVVEDDIIRLTEIKIKRISKFDIDKASDKIIDLENQIKQVKFNLDDIVNFSINYFKNLKKDYSENRERKTEIKLFDDVDATKVVIRNTKLYINREEGFIGTSLRKDEYVCDCSDIDDLIVFTKDCKVVITKVDSKTFIGKNIIHAAVFKKKDKRTIYNMIYKDGDKNFYYLKRFAVSGVTRDKVYNLSSAKKQSIVSYFSANPNGEAEIVSVILRQSTKLKKFKWDVNFSDYIIKGRSSRGNIVTKHSVNKIELKEKGVSTLKPRKIWFDDSVQRLNVDGRGELLGEFSGEDKLLIIRQNGMLKTISPEITTRFTDDMIVLEKWLPKKPISAVYFDGKKEKYFLKRFLIENENKEQTFISLNKNTFLEIVCTDWKPVIELVYNKERNKEQRSNTSIDIEEFISIKGIKAQGNQLTGYKVKQINILESKEYVPPIEVSANEIEVIDENEIIEEVKDSSENDTDSIQTTLF